MDDNECFFGIELVYYDIILDFFLTGVGLYFLRKKGKFIYFFNIIIIY